MWNGGDCMPNNDLLLMSAARLYSLGVDVEGAREKLKELVDRKVPYEAQEMLDALHNYQELSAQFNSLEKDYLILRDEMTGRPAAAD